jgi:hypothetical protein
MKNDILEAIAKNSVFGTDEVFRVYEIFKSYDLLVLACEFAQRTGYSNLETACILVKSAQRSAHPTNGGLCAICGRPKYSHSPNGHDFRSAISG